MPSRSPSPPFSKGRLAAPKTFSATSTTPPTGSTPPPTKQCGKPLPRPSPLPNDRFSNHKRQGSLLDDSLRSHSPKHTIEMKRGGTPLREPKCSRVRPNKIPKLSLATRQIELKDISSNKAKSPVQATQETNVQKTPQCHFLNVPLELRHIIYDHVYISCPEEMAVSTDATQAEYPHLNSQLLLANGQIKDEMLRYYATMKEPTSTLRVHNIEERSVFQANVKRRLRCPNVHTLLINIKPWKELGPVKMTQTLLSAIHFARDAKPALQQVLIRAVSLGKRKVFKAPYRWMEYPGDLVITVNLQSREAPQVEGTLEHRFGKTVARGIWDDRIVTAEKQGTRLSGEEGTLILKETEGISQNFRGFVSWLRKSRSPYFFMGHSSKFPDLSFA